MSRTNATRLALLFSDGMNAGCVPPQSDRSGPVCSISDRAREGVCGCFDAHDWCLLTSASGWRYRLQWALEMQGGRYEAITSRRRSRGIEHTLVLNGEFMEIQVQYNRDHTR